MESAGRPLTQPDSEESGERRGVAAFLPYDSHPTFDLIAEDWISLLRLRLPGFDVIPYLVTSATFGLLLYQLHTSANIVGGPSEATFFADRMRSWRPGSIPGSRAVDERVSNVHASCPD